MKKIKFFALLSLLAVVLASCASNKPLTEKELAIQAANDAATVSSEAK